MANGFYDDDRCREPLIDDLAGEFDVVAYDARAHGRAALTRWYTRQPEFYAASSVSVHRASMDRDDGIYFVTCPECDARVKVGLPRSARIEAVSGATAGETVPPCDGHRRKSRPNRCGDGHLFQVCFEF